MTPEIPPITDPLGRHLVQPSRNDILVDDTHALMTQETFDKIAHYETSNPTGTYNGKMWRRRDWLVWFHDLDEAAGSILITKRQIIIV